MMIYRQGRGAVDNDVADAQGWVQAPTEAGHADAEEVLTA
jgi:hypothetical protein